jgi:hypothetical protein
MTRNKKLLAAAATGLTVAALALAAAGALRQYRLLGPAGIGRSDRAELAELIRRFKAVDDGSDDGICWTGLNVRRAFPRYR